MERRWWFSGVMAMAASSAFAVLAPRQLDADPPARVGRLDYMTGAVSFRPAGSDEWAPAVPNRPLTSGDRLWTDNDSRAEMHIGSTVVRVSSQTELDFTAVDDNTLQLRLAQGSLNIRVRNLYDGQVYEIDAPNGAVTISQPGEYRVDVGPDGTATMVSVWSGNAQVSSAGSTFSVNARQQATINGVDSPTYDLTDAPAPDAWDQWCVSRDQREDNAVSAKYVSREMPGYQDLDAYGQWRYAEGYGEVWVPANEPAGWAPYHTGHWVWVDPWGWTWVDDAPWGYAPYHYGRWAYVGGGWAWIPGQIAPRPVYAPALVVFVGGGPGPRPGGAALVVGVGATVAWFALGPQEVYRPAYTTSPTYVRQVNVTNVTNVTNITVINNNTTVTNVEYQNRMAPGAIVATSGTAFATARPVQSAPIVVTHEMQTAPAIGTSPPIAPTRASLAVATGSTPVRLPPAAIESRPVVARVAPPPAPIPFAAKQQALAANGGRPLAPAEEAQIRQNSPALASASPTLVRPASVAPSGGGLKPARPGLVAAAPVSGAASQGFVPRTVPAGRAAAQPAGATAATSTPGAGNPGAQPGAQPGAVVARPPARATPAAPATPTRVPPAAPTGAPTGAAAGAAASAATPSKSGAPGTSNPPPNRASGNGGAAELGGAGGVKSNTAPNTSAKTSPNGPTSGGSKEGNSSGGAAKDSNGKGGGHKHVAKPPAPPKDEQPKSDKDKEKDKDKGK